MDNWGPNAQLVQLNAQIAALTTSNPDVHFRAEGSGAIVSVSALIGGTIASAGTCAVDCLIGGTSCLTTLPSITAVDTWANSDVNDAGVNSAANTFVEGDDITVTMDMNTSTASDGQTQVVLVYFSTP